MNKKILTKVISFVLVICMLVPIIPDLGLDLVSMTADAAMPTPSSTAVLFKTGSRYYWKSGTTDTQIPLVNSVQPKPLYSAGSYYLPVGIVNTLTGASLAATETFDGVGYIKVTHGGTVTGSWKTYISNMGFIQLTTGSDSISSASNDEQTAWIKANVFDHGSNQSAFTASSVTSTDHPYLMANQSEFDHLNSVYNGTIADETLKGYLDYIVRDAESIYTTYASDDNGTLNAKYAAGGSDDLGDILDVTREGKYFNAYGYDVGGRQEFAVTLSSRIEKLAYAYQVTRDTKFSTLALNLSLRMAAMPHWGAGHFLNAADTAYHMALVYDWCYDVWATDTASRDAVRNALFINGVIQGVYSSGVGYQDYDMSGGYFGSTPTFTLESQTLSVALPWHNNVLGTGGYSYVTRENNWNAVCSSGMIMAALALMSETGSYTGLNVPTMTSGGTQSTMSVDVSYTYRTNQYTSGFTATQTEETRYLSGLIGSTYQAASAWLINNNIYNLEQYGLGQYVPDGSYIESAGYWGYGTNSLFRTIASLDSACGHDFGLSAAMGLDKTAYFANNAQSPDGITWRYHDDNNGAVSTDMNAIYGAVTGDKNIVGYRKYLIEKGVARPSIYDTLSYDAAVTGFNKTALDYYFEGTEGYAMRSSWENGAAYVAFMGGDTYHSHGQIDSGAFVYHNNGVAWFDDVGTENYNAYGFGYGTETNENGTDSTSGTMYYPTVAEGNNTIASTNERFGQKWGEDVDTVAKITSHGSNEHGGYAILDNTSLYTASSAKRGILMTNDRKTVVIQDEITFSSSQTAYWIGHVNKSITISIEDGGKTAYLTDGITTIRCTLVTGGSDYVFTTTDWNTHYLNGTAANNYSQAQGSSVVQNDYSDWQRLVVASTGTTMNLAIVIEEIAPGDNYECGYTWTSMSSWNDTLLVNDSNNYDNKILLSKDFDVDGVGSFSYKDGNLKAVNTIVDGDNAMGAYVTAQSGASNITLTSAPAKSAHASLGNGMLVTEFDLKTLTSLPEEVTFALYGTDIYPIVSVPASELGNPTEWVHVTMVLDEANDMFYVYVGDTCIIKESFVSSSYEKLKLVISTEEGTISDDAMLFIDNAVIRTYTESYTALDSVLDGSTVGAASGILAGWADGSHNENSNVEFTGSVAKLYTVEVDAPEVDDDTPIIDFWGTAAATSDTEPGAEVINSAVLYVDSFAALEDGINSGLYTHATIYRSNANEVIQIESRIVVDTNGYKFAAISDSLICQVAGNIHTYKKGNVRVAYVINGSTQYVTYTNTTYASYDGVSGSAVGKLILHDNGDGTFNVVVTESGAWSDVEAGTALTGSDLIITSANSRFYLTGSEYTGAFVYVDGDTVTAGGDAATFFGSAVPSTTAHDKIVITSDFYYDSSNDGNNGGIGSNKNIYLNGHTITYYTSVESDHMFSLSSNRDFNVYGPGIINNESNAANVIIKSENTTNPTTFNNLTINSVHVICDHREGTLQFNNCVLNGETNRILLGVSNRSAEFTNGSGNVNNGTITEADMGILVINGGYVNAYHSTGYNAPVNVKDNARVVIKGGVVFNAPGVDCIVRVEHATAALDGGTTGVDKMYIHLGEYYTNGKTLYAYFNSTAETDINVEDHIYWVDGAAFETTTTGYDLADGYSLANTGSAGYAYRVVKTEDAATVTWKHGDEAVEEKWVAGSTPVMNTDIKNYLAGLTPSSGYKYTCDLTALEGKGVVAGSTYVFNAIQLPDITIRMSISLYSSIYANIYVPADQEYDYVKINGVSYELSEDTVTISGGSYYGVVYEISPKDGADLITVSVRLKNGLSDITAVTSVVNYAKKLISSSNQTDVTKKLMSSIVGYVGATAGYNGDRYTAASCEALINQYSEYKCDEDVYATQPTTANVKEAVKSVYLDLGSHPAFVFRMNPNFTGQVTLSYTTLDKGAQSVTLHINNGIVNGSDIYKLNLKAYDMAGDITISVVGGSNCVYNLDTYYTQAVQDNDALYDLICALKYYCAAAEAYKESL